MTNIDAYKTKYSSTWCPGCGNFGIWLSLKNALAHLGIPPWGVLVVYGVGCHGNMYDWMNAYGFVGLHGRTLPVAQGVKAANHKLPVIVITGDGDCLGEGGNHFIHAAKRNPDITVFIHDNQLYSLTTGQASPTAKAGFATKSTPQGVIDAPVNPLTLSLVAGATFVARGFSGDIPQLTKLMVEAIKHKGFSVLDILQPCVTFDKDHTYDWYRKRLYELSASGFTTNDKNAAMLKATEGGDKIPFGIFYEEDKPTPEDHEKALANMPLIDQPLTVSIDNLIKEFI
jgi:2-oxoglutarate ferredoxin oxidoreductase subunit beta